MARRKQGIWPIIAVAFVLGLLPGLGLAAWQRMSADPSVPVGTAAAQRRADRVKWDAEKAALTAELDTARRDVSRLEARVETLTAALASAKTAKPDATPSAGKKTAPQIVERRIEGEPQAGGTLTLVVRVKGDADKVTMRIARMHPDADWVKTYQLKDTGASGGVHTWKLTITAPDQRGDYRYFADAWLDDAHVSMAGTAQYVITLE